MTTVIQGTMIQAVMETALDSSLPGQTRAIISEDVFSFDGTRLLIPRGSRLIGRYRSGIEISQRRVTIAWDRIILPDNQSIQISAFGGDELGRSGVTGFVDTRFAQRFGSAALISIISAAPSAAAAQVENETSQRNVDERRLKTYWVVCDRDPNRSRYFFTCPVTRNPAMNKHEFRRVCYYVPRHHTIGNSGAERTETTLFD